LISVPIAIILSNPLRRSEEKIRESILEITPIGMDMEEVLEIIEKNKKWEVADIEHEYGYEIIDGIPYYNYSDQGDNIVGSKSIRGFVGKYTGEYDSLERFWEEGITAALYLFFETYVEVYWGFDENSKLIDVCVWKYTNAI